MKRNNFLKLEGREVEAEIITKDGIWRTRYMENTRKLGMSLWENSVIGFPLSLDFRTSE